MQKQGRVCGNLVLYSKTAYSSRGTYDEPRHEQFTIDILLKRGENTRKYHKDREDRGLVEGKQEGRHPDKGRRKESRKTSTHPKEGGRKAGRTAPIQEGRKR